MQKLHFPKQLFKVLPVSNYIYSLSDLTSASINQIVMITKYTLRFHDKNIEAEYQEHLTKTVRKPVMLSIVVISFFVSITDFIQSIIVNSFDWVSPQKLLLLHMPYFVLQGILLIVYLWKPLYARWALQLQNYLFAYSYYADSFSSIEQWKYYIFLMTGAQFLVLITSEFMDIVFQILIFGGVYLAKLILENSHYPYSLVVWGILSEFVFIMVFYVNKKHLKQYFQIKFVQSQWEQIFISQITDQYLILDYDDETQSFNFRHQLLFDKGIINTKIMRKFLRKTSFEDEKVNNLEKYLYNELQKQKKGNNIIKKQLTVVLEGGTRCNMYYSIFYGVSTILLLQKITIDPKQGQRQETEIEQAYQNKYKLFIKISYQLLLQCRKQYINSHLNFKKLTRYCLYVNLQEFLITAINLNKEINFKRIRIAQLLNKVKYLYPEKKILITNVYSRQIIYNSWQLLVFVLIGIIEKTLSSSLEVTITNFEDKRYLYLTFSSYFNDKSFSYIQELIEKYSLLIHAIKIKETCIYVFYKAVILILVNYKKYQENQALQYDYFQNIMFEKQ